MSVLISPVISEKSMNDVANDRFTFRVDTKANKYQVKKEIEKRFGVNVLNVSTIVIKGRKIKVGARRSEKILSPFKKAIVTLKKGQKIPMFETGTKEG
jgi:large subunit ribosomal protein L23